MTDLALTSAPDGGAFDLSLEGADLARDEGLDTALIVSLFTDARAGPDDPLPVPGTSRRGWWGDTAGPVGGAPVEGDRTGSLLWLLDRDKQIPETLNRARDYAERALAWLVEDGVARNVAVVASWVPWVQGNAPGDRVLVGGEAVRAGLLSLEARITRPDGSRAERRFDVVWQAVAGGQ